MDNKRKTMSIIGCVLGVIGLAVSVVGLIYVLSLYSQELFAIPFIYAAYFCIFSLPLAVVGTVLSFMSKAKTLITKLGKITGVVGIVITAAVAAIGVMSLAFNSFNSLQSAYIFNDLAYADIVSELFDEIHDGEQMFW